MTILLEAVTMDSSVPETLPSSLKNTGFTDNKSPNSYHFKTLYVQDGAELYTEANASGVACVITGNNFTLGSGTVDASISTLIVSGGLTLEMNRVQIAATGKRQRHL